MKLTVVGLGYIGLPTSIMFAKFGVNVTGIDISTKTVASLNSGLIHIEEPGLQEAFDKVIQTNTFKARLTPEKSDVYIIAVPTPNKDDEFKSCDLTHVINGIKSIIPLLERGNTLIVESTIGPRSMDDKIAPLIEQAGFKVGVDIFLVHCPERVLPGQILHELVYNNRIVGGVTPECAKAGEKVYKTFVKGEIILTDAKTAEMSKLMENTFRDVNIALANELVQVCTDLKINALDVINMANKHPRVNLHYPGPGVGGHCLAVDPYFIVAASPSKAKIINMARETNNSMPKFVVEKTKLLTDGDKGKVVTIFGLTYKGNVDDIRESPAMEVKYLLEAETDYEIRCFDPHVDKPFVEKDINAALEGSDIILILTDHNEFKDLSDYPTGIMNQPLVFDTKNLVSGIKKDVKYINFGNLYEMIKQKQNV
ncbi:nucleotide sugar dehydrogenase [Jeotgalibacillus campisalis]|uniref:Capsular polysaccharide synthesis enzyme cap5O n=1 Tax=Jeotgalibacillus campisalis TaxID=220754 RepID=A0A0C2VGM5_9BACL|nr:nucleotide sugar dehydrogenase [Jeotgalibacillus campisalis]KIL43158.1 capsular polysaccharide synthesis enzyme cap5O [Jeotgalibacillus campisalis]